MRSERLELKLRLVVEDPLTNVAMALQQGATAAAELVGPTEASPAALIFDLAATVAGALKDGRPRLLGSFVQGPPDARFVYISVGTLAGQADSEWTRRIKVPLTGLSWDLVEAAGGRRLQARIAGRDRKGGPACASVPLLPPGWTPG